MREHETEQKNGGRRKKSVERKRGITFPVWLTFNLRYPSSFLLKPVFPLAAGQRLLTLLTFFLMSLGRHSVVTFQAMNTCLRRKIAYQMPSRAFRRKALSNQAEFFSRNHRCVWTSSPPSLLTSNIRNFWFTGGGKGSILLLSIWLQAAL